MAIGQVVEFRYNGQVRIVKVEKMGADYIQGENLHKDAKIKFATYNKSKMEFVR